MTKIIVQNIFKIKDYDEKYNITSWKLVAERKQQLRCYSRQSEVDVKVELKVKQVCCRR